MLAQQQYVKYSVRSPRKDLAWWAITQRTLQNHRTVKLVVGISLGQYNMHICVHLTKIVVVECHVVDPLINVTNALWQYVPE